MTLTNNKLVNNMAAMADGVILLPNTVKVSITGNTAANNDNMATAGTPFPPSSPNFSFLQPDGIAARAHSKFLFNTISAVSGDKLPYWYRLYLLRNTVFLPIEYGVQRSV